MDIGKIEDILNPSEFDSKGNIKEEYSDFNTAKGMLQAAGIGTGAYALNRAYKSIPGGGGKILADNMHNFLGGFYDAPNKNLPQALQKAQVGFRQAKLAAAETGRGLLRIGEQFVNPIKSMTYKQTGVAPYVINSFNSMQDEIALIEQSYIDGKIDYNTAKNGVRNLEKQAHFKLTNDYSNSYMYGQQPKSDLAKYASKYVSRGSAKDFIASAGDKQIANYVISRQPGVGFVDDLGEVQVNWKDVKLMKYKNVNFSDVARGAQFDKGFFRTMTLLKGHTDPEKAVDAVRKGMNKTNAMVKGNKVVFNISPSIRPNYDWGGYNAVGIFDTKNPTKIKIMATDKRDLFGFKLGGKDTVNYVESKEVEIKDLKKEFKATEYKEPKPRTKEYKSRTAYERRVENAKTLRMNRGKLGNDIGEMIVDPYNKKYKRNSTRLLNAMKSPNPFNVAGRRTLSKTMKPILRRAGVVGGLLAAGWTLADIIND